MENNMKNKVIIGIVVSLILVLIFIFYLNYIYNVKGNFFETNNKAVLDNVSMIIKDGTLTSATIVIKNTSNKELTSGEWFRIDRLEDSGEWKKVKSISDNYAFNAIGWIIKPRGEFEDKVDWSKLYGELRKGHYRIVKEVYGNGNKKVIYAEFNIK